MLKKNSLIISFLIVFVCTELLTASIFILYRSTNAIEQIADAEQSEESDSLYEVNQKQVSKMLDFQYQLYIRRLVNVSKQSECFFVSLSHNSIFVPPPELAYC